MDKQRSSRSSSRSWGRWQKKAQESFVKGVSCGVCRHASILCRFLYCIQDDSRKIDNFVVRELNQPKRDHVSNGIMLCIDRTENWKRKNLLRGCCLWKRKKLISSVMTTGIRKCSATNEMSECNMLWREWWAFKKRSRGRSDRWTDQPRRGRILRIWTMQERQRAGISEHLKRRIV